MEVKQGSQTLKNALYQGQLQMARNLELAYLTALEDPEIESELRSISREALDVLRTTYSMMKTLETTAKHVVETMLPIIRDGVDWKDPKLISNACERTKSYGATMIDETKKVQKRDKEFVDKIQQRVGSVKLNEFKEEDRSEEKKRAVKAATNDLEANKHELQNELTKIEAATNRRTDYIRGPTFLDGLVGAASLVAIFAINPVVGGVAALTYFTGRSVVALIHTMAVDDSPSASSTEKLDRLDRLKDSIQKRKVEAEKQMDIQFETRKNELECLQQALKYAQSLDGSLTEMHTFWKNMEESLKRITDDISANESYLSKLEDGRYSERLKTGCDNAEKQWMTIIEICSTYNDMYEQESMYRFLSINRSAMSRIDLEKRMKELKDALTE